MRMETVQADKRRELLRLAELYFIKALRYANRLTKPLVLLTTGLIGTGKSTVANGIASALDLNVFSSDRLRKERAEVSPQSSQSAGYG